MKSFRIEAAGFVLWLALAMAAMAQTPPPLPQLPWNRDIATLEAATPDLQKSGIKGLAPHVPDFEAALANGKQFFPDGAVVDGKKYVMADGPAERLLVLIQAAAAAKNAVSPMPVAAVPNPYPIIGLYLGSYYDEIGKPEDAVHALDLGLALSPDPETALGAHMAGLMSEKGAALGTLKRFPEALAVFDSALAKKAVTGPDRARLERGRGFVLTELDRLDEAEAAYKDSLTLEPGNARAEAELNYIARLRAGGPKAAGGIELSGQPPQQAPPPPP